MESLNPNSQSSSFKYQEVIGQCRDLALIELSALLGAMYDRAEPALLEFADKAESNAIRSIFIEASQNIQKGRSLVEQTFQKEISKGYANFLHNHAPTPEEHKPEITQHSQWSLIDKTNLEDSLALQKIAYKASNLYYKEIYAYSQRMTLIHGGKKLADRDMPAHPVQIMNAFKTAISKLEIDNRTTLIMYALFDKYAMRGMGSIYDSCNNYLIEAGIFPNLKPIISQTTTQQRKAAEPPPQPNTSTFKNRERGLAQAASNREKSQTTATPGALSSELLETISSLLISQRKNTPEYTSTTPAPGATPVEMASKATLLRQITNIQPPASTAASATKAPAQTAATIPTLHVDQVFIEGLRNTLTEERNKLFDGVDRRRIPTADMNTIELVGMLFEQVLDDPVLPNATKALLCHLHTPYLKAAILDTRILTSEGHPAQQLLNLMVRAGSQWVDETNFDIGIYSHLQEIVDTVLANFEDNLQIFEHLHKELQEHVLRLEQKSAAIEKRSQEAARGRDKFENARIQAKQTIKDRTEAHKQPPGIILQFLKHVWTDKLILIILRDPNYKDSEVWRETLQIIDEILELINADAAEKDGIPFRKRVESLRTGIEQSLSTLGSYHSDDVDTLFKLLSGKLTEAEEQQAVAAITAAPESTKDSLGIDSKILSFTDKELEMLQKLETIKCGTWFEYLIKGHKSKRRIKLSWYSPVTKKYMFVDYNGIQAMVISAHSLVQDLCEGKARILGRTQIPFVSQAYRVIKDKLQRTLNTQPASN